MITIELMGGLGNQLFQIFTVIGYSLQNRIPFFFQDKGLSIGWRKKMYWDGLLYPLRPYLRPVSQLNAIWRENHFHHSKIPYLGNEDNKLLGYFQSYKYFDENKLEIFELIDLEAKKDQIRKKLKLVDEENTVSIHFRMGDYKKSQEHHPILSLKYYETALYLLINQSSGKKDWDIMYVCEEEDIIIVDEKIKKLRDIFPTMTFTKLDGGRFDDWEQMLAMSICRHQIIANSTFSWFGAYFNTRSTKLVYYPNTWFGPAQGIKNMNDLCPDEWQKIIV
jgi:hypothetical protein